MASWSSRSTQSPSLAKHYDIIIYMNGLYFALRSGDEHRQLRHNTCQIQLAECPGERSYLEYTEDISKNHQDSLKGHNQKPKVVKQFANLENPDRCFVKLFKLYKYYCPVKHCDDAFYLTPLRDPKEQCCMVFQYSTRTQ